jgi:hypothetical protein
MKGLQPSVLLGFILAIAVNFGHLTELSFSKCLHSVGHLLAMLGVGYQCNRYRVSLSNSAT